MAETIDTQAMANAPISAIQVQQALKLFDEGRKALATGNDRFAIYSFADAVCRDPSRRQYPKELLVVLSKESVTGPGRIATAWPSWQLKRKLDRAVASADWHAVLRFGTQLLTLRPRSISALLGLGHACVSLKYFDSAVVFLRYAHKLRPRDVLVNRHCGRVLGKVSQFDEAIACWSTVQELVPRDEEALRAIGFLAAKKMF